MTPYFDPTVLEEKGKLTLTIPLLEKNYPLNPDGTKAQATVKIDSPTLRLSVNVLENLANREGLGELIQLVSDGVEDPSLQEELAACESLGELEGIFSKTFLPFLNVAIDLAIEYSLDGETTEKATAQVKVTAPSLRVAVHAVQVAGTKEVLSRMLFAHMPSDEDDEDL